MSADDLLNALTQVLYAAIFVVALWRVARRPSRANLDIALLFGAVAAIIALSLALPAFAANPPPVVIGFVGSLLMALPYLTLRLVDDFTGVALVTRRLAEGGLVLSIVALFAIPTPIPEPIALAMVAYFVTVESYSAATFIRHANQSSGIVRRRMRTVGAGTVLLGLIILIAGVASAAPKTTSWLGLVSHLLGLASGLCYSIGFTPPAVIRRAWHEPELRAFLAASVRLPRLGTLDDTVAALERSAAAATGAPHATIGIWDRDARTLRYRMSDGSLFTTGPDELVAGWAFAAGRPVVSSDARRDDPEHAELYERTGARAILAAPISSSDTQFGVLAIFAPRAPIFADDDLTLVQLLADQAALILESRGLIEDATRMRAREEAAHLKEDFLSSAAHDLKSPLTGILGHAQLIESRAKREPAAPIDLPRVQRIIAEARRMSALIASLLDAARAEDLSIVSPNELLDLRQVVEEVCQLRSTQRHPCLLDAPEPVVGRYDRIRVGQLVENLVENAAKYSPDGGQTCLRLWREDDRAHLTVTDHGIGIPAGDLPLLFQRFHRGSNVDDRRFVGMGLGLYICRRIAEQHGGRISATSPGVALGTTIHVELPAERAPAHEPVAVHVDGAERRIAP